MESDKTGFIAIELKLKHGFRGRFDFTKFLALTGFKAVLENLDDKRSKKTEQDIHRLYNTIVGMWAENKLIRFIGY